MSVALLALVFYLVSVVMVSGALQAKGTDIYMAYISAVVWPIIFIVWLVGQTLVMLSLPFKIIFKWLWK